MKMLYIPTGSSKGVVFFFLGLINFQAGIFSGGGGGSRGQDLVCVMHTGCGYKCESPFCLNFSLALAYGKKTKYWIFNIDVKIILSVSTKVRVRE